MNKRTYIVEGLSDILYHVTTLDSAASIIGGNKFVLSPVMRNGPDEKSSKPNKLYFMSTARSPKSGYVTRSIGAGPVPTGVAIMVLDGKKLSQRYSGGPTAYFSSGIRNAAPNEYDEQEDRVYSDDREIPDARNYIKSVYVVLSLDASPQARNNLLAIKKSGIPTYLYTNPDDAQSLRKDRARSVSEYTFDNDNGTPLKSPFDRQQSHKAINRHRQKNGDNYSRPPHVIARWITALEAPVSAYGRLPYDTRQVIDDLAFDYRTEQQVELLKGDLGVQNYSNYVTRLLELVKKNGLRNIPDLLRFLRKKWSPVLDNYEISESNLSERIGSPLSTSKTLYHGTTLENARDALQHGIWPSVGDFVADMYGLEDYEHEELIFAADKEGISKALSAMSYHVAKKLHKQAYQLTSKELYQNGAILVLKNGEEDFDHFDPEDYDDIGEHPPAVEPDDYYRRYGIKPDYILTGKKLRRFVTRLGLKQDYQSGIMHGDQQKNLQYRKNGIPIGEGEATSVGYKIMGYDRENGNVFSIANPDDVYPAKIGIRMRATGNGIYLGNTKRFVTQHYTGLHDGVDALVTMVYDPDTIISGTDMGSDGEFTVPTAKIREIEILDDDMAEANTRDHRAALESTGFWGNAGAGCLIMAKDTKRILIPKRSAWVQEPHTWSTWGGAIDRGEDPKTAAIREVEEEAGYEGEVLDMIHLYTFKSDDFRYDNYVAIVATEFEPELNWESDEAEWFAFGDWPSPLHFGLEDLLKNGPAMNKLGTLSD